MQNGTSYSNGASNYNGNGNNAFHGAYNGQSNFNGNQNGSFGNQGSAQNGANHSAQFPFNPQQQPVQPMMPFSMPPPNFP